MEPEPEPESVMDIVYWTIPVREPVYYGDIDSPEFIL